MAIRPSLHVAVPKQKSRASEYNENFDLMLNYIDESITESKNYVDEFMPEQTGKNGRFLTTNGTNTSWVSIGQDLPAADYISGLGISRVNNTTIKVEAGSCYDINKIFTIKNLNARTKTNSEQAANRTYYVFIIASATAVDLLISTTELNPVLPSPYIYYRLIGKYFTDSNSNIIQVSNINIGQYGTNSDGQIVTMVSPNFSQVVSYSINTWHEMTQNGTLVAYAISMEDNRTHYLDIKKGSSGTVRTITICGDAGGYSGGIRGSIAILVSKGDYIQGRIGSGDIRLFPSKGGN